MTWRGHIHSASSFPYYFLALRCWNCRRLTPAEVHTSLRSLRFSPGAAFHFQGLLLEVTPAMPPQAPPGCYRVSQSPDFYDLGSFIQCLSVGISSPAIIPGLRFLEEDHRHRAVPRRCVLSAWLAAPATLASVPWAGSVASPALRPLWLPAPRGPRPKESRCARPVFQAWRRCSRPGGPRAGAGFAGWSRRAPVSAARSHPTSAVLDGFPASRAVASAWRTSSLLCQYLNFCSDRNAFILSSLLRDSFTGYRSPCGKCSSGILEMSFLVLAFSVSWKVSPQSYFCCLKILRGVFLALSRLFSSSLFSSVSLGRAWLWCSLYFFPLRVLSSWIRGLKAGTFWSSSQAACL